MDWKTFWEIIISKITSGRFISTCVVVGVYAYLACNGVLKEDRIMEITLLVLYAYFSKPRPDLNNKNDNDNENGNGAK